LPSVDRFLGAMLTVIGAPHLAESERLRENFEALISYGSLATCYHPSNLALSLLSLMLERSYADEWLKITDSLKQIFKVEDEYCFNECRLQMGNMLKEHHSPSPIPLAVCVEKENRAPEPKYPMKIPTWSARPASRKRSRRILGLSASLESIDHILSHDVIDIQHDHDVQQMRKPSFMSVDVVDDVDEEVLHVLYSIICAQQD